MPINYDRYPPNWLSEIRPRILNRAGEVRNAQDDVTAEACCENCNLRNGQAAWSVKHRGKVTGWFSLYGIAMLQPMSAMLKGNCYEENPKRVTVVLTVAHLDHDETNHDVKDERLAAWCQLCHLRYDAKEKKRRASIK